MTAHTHNYDALKFKLNGNNIAADPGTGGTIKISGDDMICPLTIAAAGETRSLPPIASYGGTATLPQGQGIRLTVVANQITNSGDATINGVNLSREGDAVTFETRMVDGSRVWQSVGGGREISDVQIPITSFRVWDALQTPALGTPANDDLGINSGTYLTSVPYITSGSISNTTATRRARVLVPVPADYRPGGYMALVATWVRSDAAQVTGTIALNATLNGDATTDICNASFNANGAISGETVSALTTTGITEGETLDIRATIALDDTGGSGAEIRIHQLKLRYERLS